MKFEVKNRFSGDVQFTAEIEADENTYWRVKIGMALKWAIEHKAVLRGAVLRGADLRGFKIIRVLARAVRNDGYEFIGFETDKDLLIRAGCRTMLIGDYRQHIAREYPNTDKATETTDILDSIEMRAKKLGYAEPVAIAAE